MSRVIYNAPLTHILPYTKAYHDLSPLTNISEEGTYLDIARWLSLDEESIACNASNIIAVPATLRFSVDIKTYNLDALVEMAGEFHSCASESSKFAWSILLIEQWPTQAVEGKDGIGSVVPWREHGLLMWVIFGLSPQRKAILLMAY